jgi:hypothetical protein
VRIRRVVVGRLVPLAAVLLVAAPAAAQALTFTPGDVVVYRVGTGSGSLGSSSTALFLDEYSPTGALVGSLAMPTAASGSNHPLTASGSASSEGLLTLSGNGQYLMVPGYDTPPGTSSVAGTSSSSVPRAVGRVDASGNIDTSTIINNQLGGNNVRSATSSDGTNIWEGGAAGGVVYTTLGSSTGTALSSTDTNVREVMDAGGQLYTSADPSKAGSLTIAKLGSGLPTTAGQTGTNLSFNSAPAEPYGYAFVTLGSSSSTPDTLYVADNSANAIVKYSLEGSTWTKTGSAPLSGVSGLTADDVSGTVDLYATTGTASSPALYALTDSTGYKGTLSGTPTKIASPGSNETILGVAYAPGTTFGTGSTGGTTAPGPSITTADTSLEASMQDPTNPALGITVSDPSYSASQLTVTANSSNLSVASSASVSGTGASRLLTATPALSVGYSTITVTVTDPAGASAQTAISYGLSAYSGDPSDRYYAGAGNGSTEIDVGGGYMLVGDDLSNVLHLYQEGVSGPPVANFDFSSQLPDGTTSVDIESAARVGNVIYWLGSLSNSDSGDARPAANTLFATQVNGSGASTTLTYLGSYTNLRADLINWDENSGNPLGLAASSSGTGKSTSGINLEGLEFAKGSSTTAYLAFRAPLEPTTNRTKALLVPLTNIPSLINAAAGSATFGSPIEMNLDGLGLREIRENADGQYLIVAGTADASNSLFQLYTWDGNAGDAPTLTGTSVPAIEDGAWEGIVSVPDPLVNGSKVELVEDNGDTAWYGDAATSKTGLAPGLQKDLGRTFTVTLPSQTVSITSTPPTVVGATYAVTASASSGLPVTISTDPATTNNACSVSGNLVQLLAAGTCVIDANQGGNISFAPAVQAQQSFTVTAPGHSTTGGLSCVLTSVTRQAANGHDTAEVTVTDPNGIAEITNVFEANASVSVPDFASGTSGPIDVIATKSTQGVTSYFLFDVIDSNGKRSECA